MSIQPGSNTYGSFVARYRMFFLVFLICVIGGGGWLARRVTLAAKITDYYPSLHPHVRLYQEFPEMLKLTNAVVVTVTVKEGTIYTNETLGKIHRISVDLLDTKGVNPFEVMSLTTPRLKDIRVQDGSINIMPVVEGPEQPQRPEVLARIKNAVYTNLGIRGVYVSPDDKTALIRAGFWDGMAEPRVVFERLQALVERERDVNTEVEFTGNLALAAWLIDTAPRVLLLLFVSGGIAILLTGQMLGVLSGAVLVVVVSLVAACCGLGLLGIQRLTLDPFSLLVIFPLGVRGVTLATQWSLRFAHTYQQVITPFAEHESRLQALERTGAALWRPFTMALCADAGALLLLLFVSDVPVIRTLGIFAAGWITGLLIVLWAVLPLWSIFVRPPSVRERTSTWFQQLAVRFMDRVGSVIRPLIVSPVGGLAVGALGIIAALQLQAGREMMGTTLFYASHPYNRAFTRVNEKFIGVNQLIVIAQAIDPSSFRDPSALLAVESFQHYMAEDEQLGGSFAITNLVKAVTRMFHEDIPKWEVVPDDLNSAGQVVFRVVSSAATPSEVARLLSTDFRTTAVTLFYHRYSPVTVERALSRAQEFMASQNGQEVQFRLGGGLLGILAAVHAAVEQNYWYFIGFFLFCASIGAVGCGTAGRETLRIMKLLLLTQAVVFLLLWGGGIDLNIYTLPLIMVGTGTVLLPAFLTWDPEDATVTQGLAITSLTVAASAAVWLFSPMRLQAEMGVFLIVLAVIALLFARQMSPMRNDE
jgi:predicted RND superfamily exporter protein